MEQTIKAIETEYKGYRFRSRLEARWAVFFDMLELEWEYEAEGFILENGTRYLPDFWLPKLNTFVEIKPKTENYGAWPKDVKAFDLANLFQKSGDSREIVILCGTPGPVELYEDTSSYYGFVQGDYSYVWCECPDCGSLGIQFDGRSARNKHTSDCHAMTGDKGYNRDSPRLLGAYAAARSARFEFGENGL